MAEDMGSPSMPGAPHSNQYAMPMSIDIAELDEEDSDEYEYEYSTTEIETFYVTLDLTTPNVPVKRKLIKTHPRRNAKQWLNPGLGKHRRYLGDSTIIEVDKGSIGAGKGKGKATQKTVNEDDDDGSVDDFDDEDPSQTPVPESASELAAQSAAQEPLANFDGDANSQNEAATEAKPEIQILDLHDAHPVVSYEGNIYKCQWEENMGTELLFTAYDPDSPLPSLRHVSDEVDLLAASAARITSTRATAKEKDPTVHYGITRMNKYGKIRDLKIPVGAASSDQRKSQAYFLQSLIHAKDAKHEKDMVTVMAKSRNTNTQWRQIMKQKRAEEKAQIRKDMQRGIISMEAGQRRLEVMAKEEELLQHEDKLRGYGPDGKRYLPVGRKKTMNSEEVKGIVRRPPGGMYTYLAKNREVSDDGTGDIAVTPQSYSNGYDEDMEDYDEAEAEGLTEYAEDDEMEYDEDAQEDEDDE